MSATGGCACGKVRFLATGDPDRVGLCHCTTCRKKHGAPYNVFVVYPADRVKFEGEMTGWKSSEHATRYSCARCASPIYMDEPNDGVVELHLGSFDDVGIFEPTAEIWTIRREPWLRPLDVEQNDQGR